MISPTATRPTTLQILQQRAEAATERHDEAMENLDITSNADWAQLYLAGRDAHMSVWSRNEYHRMQHQTAKSILSST